MLIIAVIVESVINGTSPPMRPTLPETDTEEINGAVKGLMKQCWAEHPHERPTIDEVSKMLRSINKGRSVNYVVDCSSFLCFPNLLSS
jgi:hypothetical protein